MNTTTNTLPGTPNYNELETCVRDAAHQGVESINSWLASAWNKILVVLATAHPYPGDGMH
jgi:hypothetical protein